MAVPPESVGPGGSDALTSRAAASPSSLSRSWLALLAFGLNSGFNAFICMNFAVVSDLTQSVLDTDEDAVAWFYSGMLLMVFFGMPVGLVLVVWWEGAGLCFSVIMNAASSVVRWVGVMRRDYVFCLLSALLNGASAWTILPMPAQLSEQRFPPEKWSFTTSLAVMANYSGWMLGSFLVPLVVVDHDSMEHFMLLQMAFSAVVVFVFVACYRPVDDADVLRGRASRVSVSFLGAPDDLPSEAMLAQGQGQEPEGVAGAATHPPCLDDEHRRAGDSSGHGSAGLRVFMDVLCANPSLGMQMAASGCLGGVSFTIPGCNDTILSHAGFSSQATSWINLAFMASGVSSGLILGYKCSNPARYGCILKAIFCIATVAVTALAAFVRAGHPSDDNPIHLAIIFALTILAGVTSLGFIGIGIEAAALYPAGGTYVCFFIELLIQLVGGVLSKLSSNKDGFITIAAATWLSTILLLIGYRHPQPRDVVRGGA